MTGYLSSTSLKCPTDREYKFTYVSARTLATRFALVRRHISEMIRVKDQQI
jgi:hypothetical protein